jgi:hypothetical protein
MNTLFKKRAKNSVMEDQADLIANRIATKIISHQRTFAGYLKRITQNIPLKIQGYTLMAFGCLCLCYCGLLLFGESSPPLQIKTIQPLKETRISTADSLNKLENIYQHYLKR